MYLEDKIPYQFGDPRNGDYIVFDCNNRGLSYTPRVKRELVNSDLFDGEAKLNGSERNKLDDTVFSLSFGFDSSARYTPDYILRLFTGSPQRMFFWQVGYQDGFKVKRVLWQYAEAIGLPQVTSGVNNSDGEGYKIYKLDMRLIYPELYEADNTLGYFVGGQTYPIYDGTYDYNGAITYGQYETSTFPLWSTLTDDSQKYNFLTNKKYKPLSLQDRFFKLELNDISVSGSLLQYNLTVNTPVVQTSAGLNLLCSRPTYTFLTQIDQLSQNEWVQITNLTTDSDIKITWLDTVNSGGAVLYNSFWNLLFYVVNGQEVPAEKYTIDYPRGTPLYFSPHVGYETNEYRITKSRHDALEFIKNTSGTQQIRISTLPAFI